MPDALDFNQFPERVLQFGTGILLRGLPDYFIDNANRQGVFCGRIVVVKSTPGKAEGFEKNGNSYVTCVRGIDDGKTIEENFINSSISRVLSAQQQWPDILQAACQPTLQVIISNTTEIGINFEPETIFNGPPNSFPAKLTSILHERFKTLGTQSGELVIIPTELIQDNGKLLQDIVSRQIEHNHLGEEFSNWLIRKVSFCNSLVDRIVTKPSDAVKQTNNFNSMTIQAEPYKLWAIEGDEKIQKVLSFSDIDAGVIITEDIAYYRERKIRLLNGTHTISVCLGFLNGLNTVYECMQDRAMSTFVENVMLKEIAPTLELGTPAENEEFARQVLDRFRNPYTAHRLLSITLQATAKMKMRNVATLFRYAEKFNNIPPLMAKGFAAYLLFMKATHHEQASYFGLRRGEAYPIQDDQASYFFAAWKDLHSDEKSIQEFVRKVSQNTDLWDKDLTQIPTFVETVSEHLTQLMSLAQS